MKLQAFNCPNCKAPLNLPSGSQDRRFIFCQYCGAKIMFDDIEYYREDSKTERTRIRAVRDVQKNDKNRDAEIEKERLKRECDAKEGRNLIIMFAMGLAFMIFLFIYGAVMSHM